MSIMVVTTRITRQYLERKTKSDLAQMYLDLLDEKCRLESNLDKLWHSAVCPLDDCEQCDREAHEVDRIEEECRQRRNEIELERAAR